MSWVRIDDAAPEHPKLLAAGAAAVCFWLCCLAYCNRQQRRDGFIPETKVKLLYPGLGKKQALRLVEVGLLEERPDGYAIHDYHDYQPSESLSDARSMAGKQGGIKSGEARRSKKEASASKQTDEANEAPSLPVPIPSHPDPESSHSAGARKDRFMQTFETLIPESFPISDQHRDICRKKNLDVQNELAKHRIYAKQHSRRCLDWPADFELWLRNAHAQKPGKGPVTPEPIESPYLAEARAAGIGTRRGDLL